MRIVDDFDNLIEMRRVLNSKHGGSGIVFKEDVMKDARNSKENGPKFAQLVDDYKKLREGGKPNNQFLSPENSVIVSRRTSRRSAKPKNSAISKNNIRTQTVTSQPSPRDTEDDRVDIDPKELSPKIIVNQSAIKSDGLNNIRKRRLKPKNEVNQSFVPFHHRLVNHMRNTSLPIKKRRQRYFNLSFLTSQASNLTF